MVTGANIEAMRMLVVRDLEEKITALESNLNESNSMLAQLGDDYAKQVAISARLSGGLDTALQDLDKKALALSEAESELKASTVTIESLTADIQQLHDAGAALSDANTRLRASQVKLGEENDRLRAENGRLSAKLGSQKGSMVELENQAELIRRLQTEQHQQIADACALQEENDKLIIKLNEMAAVFERMNGYLASHENHKEKTAKLMAAQFADLQRTRRSHAYVSRLTQLLQKHPIYTTENTLDVYLLSTSSEFLGDKYRSTPYCVYLLLEVSGKGHVIFEHNGKLVSQSGSRLPLTAEQKVEVVECIKSIEQKQIRQDIHEGIELISQECNAALASKQSQHDMKELGGHFMNEPNDTSLINEFQAIIRWYHAYGREHAQRQKQKKKLIGKARR